MSATTVTIACPLRDCDEGTITVEISGRYRPACGFDPPEWPEFAAIAATCGHLDAAYEHPTFDDAVQQALNAIE